MEPQICGNCDGTGVIAEPEYEGQDVTCQDCNGTGLQYEPDDVSLEE